MWLEAASQRVAEWHTFESVQCSCGFSTCPTNTEHVSNQHRRRKAERKLRAHQVNMVFSTAYTTKRINQSPAHLRPKMCNN